MANIEKRLYIGGLSDRVQENDLNEKFGKFGQVLSVEIKSRKNDTGETAKTFAYVSMKTTENDLKKCFSVYNNTKWKGHQMVIQTAKEDFISRLKKERQSALAESSEQVTESTLEKNLAAAGVHNFVKKGAVPGTPIPGEKNWVVGKFGRVLPIVHIRRKDKKKIFKYDPSQHSHQLKKLDSQEVTDVSLEDLTWELEDRESRYGKENGNVEEVDMSEDDTGIRKREDEDLSVSGSTGEKIKKGKTKEKRKLLRKEKTPKRVKSSEDVEESDCLILDRTIPDEDVAMVTETACEDVERQTYSDTETFQQTEKEYMSSMSKFYDFKDDFFAREEDLLDRLEYDKSLKERLENMSTVRKDDNDENDSFEVVSENVTPKQIKPKKSKLSESKKRTKTGVDGKDSDVESCGSADTDDICTSVKSVKKKKRLDTDEIKTVPTEKDTPETKTKKKKKEKKSKLVKKSDLTEKSDAEISESVSMTPGEGKATIKTKTLEKTTKSRMEKLKESDVDKSAPKSKTLRMTESMKTGESLDESDVLILDKTITDKDVTMVTETVCEDVQRQTNSDIEKETQQTEEKHVSSVSKFYDFKDDFFAREEDLLDRLEYDMSLKERLENMSTVHKDDNDENDSFEVVSENVTPKEMKPKKSKLSESKKRTKTGVDGKDSDVESCGSADTDDICTSVKSVKKKKRIDTDEIKIVPTEKDNPETKTKKKKKEKKSKLVKKSDKTEKSDSEVSESVTMTPGEGKATIKTKTLEKTTKSRMEKLKESDVDKSTPKSKTLRMTESMKTGESLDESDVLILDKTITDKYVTMVTETVCEDVQRQTNSDIEKETFQETEEKHMSSMSKFYDFKDDFFAREEDLLDRLEYDMSLKERLENMSTVRKDDNDENDSLEVVSENVTPKEMKPKKSKLSESKKRTKTGVDGKDSDVESCGSADTDDICTSVKSVKKKKRIDTDEIKTGPTEKDTPETKTKKKKKEKKSKLAKKSDKTEKSDSEVSESVTMTPGERKATIKTKTLEKTTKSRTEKLRESDVDKSTPKTKTLKMTESMKTGESLDESDFLILDKTITDKDVTMVTETVCEDVQRQTNSDIEKETFQETEEKHVSSMSKFYDFKDDFFAREEDLLDRLEYDKSLKERLENMSTVHKDDNDENDSFDVVSENVTPKEMKPKKSKLSESKKRTKTGVDGKDSDVESCGSADTDDICTSVKSVKKKKRIDTDEIKTVPTEKDTPETNTKKKKKSKLAKKSNLTEENDSEISESVTMTPGERKATPKTKTFEKATKSHTEKLEESDVESVGSADTDNICQSVKNVCSNTKNTPSDQKVPPSNQNTSPSNKVDSEENLVERAKDQRRTLDEDLQTPVSKKKDIETPDEANDLAETEDDKPSNAGSAQDDTSDKTQGEENADQADKGKKKKKDKTKEKEKNKIKTKQDKHVLSNQKRLESLREKQESLQKQKMLIKEALASVDSKQSSGKHVFFGSDGEDSADDTGQEEKKSSENADKEPMESDKKEKLKKDGKEKMTLFDSDDDNSDEDGNHSDIDRFEIKAQYEGKSGQKLMKLQERFSRDERFKLDERFLDSDEEESESDENKTETDEHGDGTAEMEDYNLAEEKSKEMSILQQVIGTKAFLSTSTTVKKSNFKDITKLHFDPTKKDHEQYETGKKDQKMSEKKADKKEQKEEELPEVSEEKFFEVSENLKEVFDEDKGFSFGFFNDVKDKTIEADVDNNLKEEEPAVSVPLMKAPWQPKVFRYDSSSDDDDEDVDKEIAETMETGTDKSQMKTEEQKVMKSTPKHPTFFFQESDPRLTEGPSLFCRPPNEDELQSKWEELKPTLQNDYRKQHREARRLSRKAANNRRGKKW